MLDKDAGQRVEAINRIEREADLAECAVTNISQPGAKPIYRNERQATSSCVNIARAGGFKARLERCSK
jgi:hypothetical protein